MASKLKGLWHHLVDSLLHYVMHFFWSAVVIAAIGVLAYLRGNQALFIGSAIGVAFCLLVVVINYLLHVRIVWKREHRLSWKRRRELSGYTSAGLDWKITGATEVGGKAVAILRVSPTSELPQPLELHITCLGGIEAVVGTSFYPDKVRVAESDPSAQFEIPHHPSGQKDVFVTLRSPKLHPPSVLTIQLRSVGNAEIRVLTVKRSLEGWTGSFWL